MAKTRKVATRCASNINEQEGQGQGGCDRFTAIYSIQLDIVRLSIKFYPIQLDIVSIKFYSIQLLDSVGLSIKLLQLQWAVE